LCLMPGKGEGRYGDRSRRGGDGCKGMES
jgi:hypothetical protein